MTVADVICKIGKIRETIDALNRGVAANKSLNNEHVVIDLSDAYKTIDLLNAYQDELENKIIK